MTHEQFKRIWIPLSSDFYRTAYSFLENEADAKDAVQDMYIRLWNSRNGLEGILNPKAYGLTLIRNICIDRIRQRNTRRNEDVSDARKTLLSDMAADSRAIGREDIRRLNMALGELPEQQKDIIRYRFFKGMDIKEISEKTGLSQVYVRVMLTRARQKLKKLMTTEKP